MNKNENEVLSIALPTDRAGEIVRVQRPGRIAGVEFWTVSASQRHWSMHHDTFTASLVVGPSTTHAKWMSRGRERTVKIGSVQLMEPGEAHRTTAVSEPTSFFVVWWSPEVLARAAEELGLGREVHWKEAQSEDPRVTGAFRRLYESVNEHSTALAVETCYVEATTRLLDTVAERTPQHFSVRHPNVRRALEYLSDCFAENVSLDNLAREARLSKFHLARCFRETVGLAPHQYQKLLRVQAARRLIERGTSVRDAAGIVGFADGPHLTRTFRDWLGVAPSAWARTGRAHLPAQPPRPSI